MVGQQQGEVSIAVALCAQDDLVLLLRQGRVLRVHVLHDTADLLRVHRSCVLEPHHLAVDAAEIAKWTDLLCCLLQNVVVAALLVQQWGRLRGIVKR